jgi:hypothetical protein
MQCLFVRSNTFCIGPIVLHCSWRNWNVSVVGVVTRLRAGRSGIRISSGTRDFSYSNRPNLLWGPSSLLLDGCRGSFPGVKRLGRDGDHSRPSSAEVNPLSPELNSICYLLALLAHDFLHVSRIRVKHEWSYTAAVPVSWTGTMLSFFLYCECLQSNGPKQYLWMEMWLDTLFCCRTPSHCDNFKVLWGWNFYLKHCGGNS